MTRARQYIDENKTEDLSLKQVATAVNTSATSGIVVYCQ